VTRGRIRIAGLLVKGLLVTLALAAFVSPFASSAPDGLNKVAADHGFDATAREGVTARSPLAEYTVQNVEGEKATKGLAGAIGVAITLIVAVVIFGSLGSAIRRRSRPPRLPAVRD
jgi:hypothetical protein